MIYFDKLPTICKERRQKIAGKIARERESFRNKVFFINIYHDLKRVPARTVVLEEGEEGGTGRYQETIKITFGGSFHPSTFANKNAK